MRLNWKNTTIIINHIVQKRNISKMPYIHTKSK